MIYKKTELSEYDLDQIKNRRESLEKKIKYFEDKNIFSEDFINRFNFDGIGFTNNNIEVEDVWMNKELQELYYISAVVVVGKTLEKLKPLCNDLSYVDLDNYANALELKYSLTNKITNSADKDRITINIDQFKIQEDLTEENKVQKIVSNDIFEYFALDKNSISYNYSLSKSNAKKLKIHSFGRGGSFTEFMKINKEFLE